MQIDGVHINIGFSTIIVIFILLYYSSEFLKYILPQFALRLRPLIVIEVIMGLLLSISLHEFAHYLLMRSYGLKITEVGFFPMGAYVATKSPMDQLMWTKQAAISLAGPLTNIVLSFLLFGITRLAKPQPPRKHLLVIGYLGVMNIVIGVFNLLPLGGLDGGSALGALIRGFGGSRRTGNMIPIMISALAAATLFLFLVKDAHKHINQRRHR